jgi:glutaconyl-CoA/methylmalonyl-CoA decarboxylase subunit gamma
VKRFKVTVDGSVYEVEVEELDQNGGSESPVPKNKSPEQAAVQPVAVASTTGKKADDGLQVKEKVQSVEKDSMVKAPMPGSVLEVKVKAGDAVSSGDVLIVLEAMKMENELTSPQDGSVKEVFVKKGDTVNSGDPLVALS